MLLDHFDYEKLLVPLNLFYDLHTGGPRRPIFHDVAATRPELLELDRNFSAIREEVLNVLPERASIPRYHELDAMQTYISGTVDKDRDWKVFPLNLMGVKPKGFADRCPRTVAILDTIPGLFEAFFSILEGGKSIPAHEGPYRGYLRYHLGLVVPEENPPSIRLKDQVYTWKEGESILFDDSWDHEVYNSCTQDRVILIVDIRRPMPQPFDAVNRAAQAIMKPIYGGQIARKLATMTPPATDGDAPAMAEEKQTDDKEKASEELAKKLPDQADPVQEWGQREATGKAPATAGHSAHGDKKPDAPE
ncbi:Aspartyl/Asparaginyl beta-hydroxylase [Aquisphaera giovannonii]|uniref:Aspartyl/Asparaginyl beta-hydroxylase n=1 Tax=Aquisphaera giovannonii TaxID=406548 RepID=A0A5B9WCE0_9BACT|nr:aspartyl/asparaginyl beta-hydroxylase domain-containing protein [Aquisphaera giovannonii]QEH37934.1 Aspartyl/Asparaginyl beta-hydroxylase [Aquisphaera giovannonii]